MLECIQQFFFLFAQPELTLNNNHKMLEPVKNSKKPIKVSQKKFRHNQQECATELLPWTYFEPLQNIIFKIIKDLAHLFS